MQIVGAANNYYTLIVGALVCTNLILLFMSIEYVLMKNHLTEADDYRAQVQNGKSISLSEVFEEMLRRGSTTTRPDLEAVTGEFFQVIKDFSEQGQTLNLPFFNTSFSISGVFESIQDVFDASRHSVNLKITPSKELRNLMSTMRVEKQLGNLSKMRILEVFDSVKGVSNSEITSGGVIKISGVMIKVLGADAKVFFVSANGHEIPVQVLVENNPSHVIAMVPVLEPGAYTLKISTRYGGSGEELKSIRSCAFDTELTVR